MRRNLVAALRVDLLLQASVVSLEVVDLGHPVPDARDRSRDDLAGDLERLHRIAEARPGGVENSVTTQVERDQKDGREQQNDHRATPSGGVDRHRRAESVVAAERHQTAHRVDVLQRTPRPDDHAVERLGCDPDRHTCLMRRISLAASSRSVTWP